MKEASFYKDLGDKTVRCELCPHYCKLADGETGICRVRTNHNGVLMSDNYGKICSLRFDPIEKKPLYNFHPGDQILSVGSVGCNLACKFCQNWEISQTGVAEYPYLKETTPEEIVGMASGHAENAGIAYTYNEPTVWYEFMLDIARMAKEKGLYNVMVSNGFINMDPLDELNKYMDAYNIDFKAFNDKFYNEVAGARLKPVLKTIEAIKKAGKHLELTNLVITDLNDDPAEFTEMVQWIRENTGKDTPLHISRYFPVYKLNIESTSVRTLQRFYEIATEHLSYVYLGNTHTSNGSNTLCPGCGKLVIERSGYSTYKTGLDKEGNCRECGRNVIEFI